MSRLTVLGIGLPLAVTLTILSSLCVAVAAVGKAIAVATARMRGSDSQLFSPMTLAEFLYGLVAIAASLAVYLLIAAVILA